MPADGGTAATGAAAAAAPPVLRAELSCGWFAGVLSPRNAAAAAAAAESAAAVSLSALPPGAPDGASAADVLHQLG
eukprot:gene34753-63079_t